MPAQITYTEALNLVLCQIERATDDTQLIVTLQRLAAICAGRTDGPELFEGLTPTSAHGQTCAIVSNWRWW